MGSTLGDLLPLWSCIPFAGMLLSVAIIPMINDGWWEANNLKISLFWALAFLIPFGISFGKDQFLFHVVDITVSEFLPFITLLFGLFIVSGGIALKGSIAGTPRVNVLILLIGTLLASWIGTTGAAMLLIRPLIRANEWRENKKHLIIFFIFLVANIGGCLTPVGDPPLFLGFLEGVPFFWTMRLLPMMLFNTVILLAVFFVIDRYYYKKDLAAGNSPEENAFGGKLRIEGKWNILYLGMIIGAVILDGVLGKADASTLPAMLQWLEPVTGGAGLRIFTGNIFGEAESVVLHYSYVIQCTIILGAAALSMYTTSRQVRLFNNFNLHPIGSVARIFVGIFLTMIPALEILKSYGNMLEGLTASHLFWMTGGLSAFLDNTPTYLVFLTAAASGGKAAGLQPSEDILAVTAGIIPAELLIAVSAGAVFMGALTYIGNAPNLMSKSIAEEHNIRMPGFFGYMGWSLLFLVPVFLLDSLLFL